jgi:recombination protein RecR
MNGFREGFSVRVSPVVKELMEEFGRLPGIGPKSAERLTHHLLQLDRDKAEKLARAILAVTERIRPCRRCFNLAEGDLCEICLDPGRDASVICVVEKPKDLAAVEKTGSFRGVYHVLGGRIAPLEGVTPDRLHIESLVDRVRRGGVREVIMATNPTLEGDGTSLYLSNVLADYEVKITRLARGLATGTVLEFANREMLADALSGRQTLSN